MCRSRRELSNAYLLVLAKFGFDTAETEPCKVCPILRHAFSTGGGAARSEAATQTDRPERSPDPLSDRAADAKPGHRAVGCTAYCGILIGLPRSKISKTSTSTQISAIILFLRKSRPHLALVCKLTERPKIDESNMFNHFL